MMFDVLVRNKVCCPMDTFKESEKNCTLLVVRPWKSTRILQFLLLFALLLSLSLYFSLQNQLAKPMEKRKQHWS